MTTLQLIYSDYLRYVEHNELPMLPEPCGFISGGYFTDAQCFKINESLLCIQLLVASAQRSRLSLVPEIAHENNVQTAA